MNLYEIVRREEIIFFGKSTRSKIRYLLFLMQFRLELFFFYNGTPERKIFKKLINNFAPSRYKYLKYLNNHLLTNNIIRTIFV